jgi:peptide/nickel transport system permease protein
VSDAAHASYWQIVRAQFRKNRGAVVASWLMAVLVLLGTYAPLLAHSAPFWTSLEDAPASPWLASLLDPSVFPLDVDLFFNLLMGTLPVGVVLWFVKRGPARRTALTLWFVAHVALFLYVSSIREDLRRPVADWPARVAEADASAAWPPFRHHPADRRSEFALTGVFSRGELAPGAAEPASRPFYLLGSDNLGNDVFTRLLYGTRISITIGLLSVALYVVIGIVLGGLSGYFGGWIDDILMFLAQVVMTLPWLFLILFFLSVLEKPSIYHIALIIALLGWPTVMRLVRGEFLRQREIDYVAAAKALGLPNRRIIFRHIAPNTLAPVLVTATFGVAGAILVESTLAFLGLGDQAAPSWGQLLQVGFENAAKGRHLVWCAGLAIFATVLILNLIGEGLRDALDPKLRK